MEEKQAIELLKKYSKGNDKVLKIILNHCKAVEKVALDLAKNIPDIDIELIRIGSLLHDIGRFDCPPGKDSIKHGVRGGEILRKENQEQLARIAETHIGAGISKEEIKKQGLPLPKKDFIPITKEEKIIACADNLVFVNKTDFDRVGSIEECVERYKNELGEEYGKEIKNLYDEIISLKNK